MKWISAIALPLATLALAGCGGGSGGSPANDPVASLPPAPPAPPPPPPPPVSMAAVEREIMPSQTSSAIAGSAQPHIAITPAPAVQRNRLFVMLPGTGANPRTYRLIVRHGASRGYHTIGLDYPNDEAVAQLCPAGSAPTCAGDLRREVITGASTSSLVAVNEANSIVGRLTSLLQFLSRSFPNEGWSRFLINDRPDWSLISVGGHSQGAGHAAFLGKIEQLDRIAMFSGPTEPAPQPGTVAAWLNLPNVTPVARQYGFTHADDNLAPLGQTAVNWVAIGLGAFGGQMSVDDAVPPFGGSHQLITRRAPNPNPTGPTASPTHGAPVVDAVTPIDANGQPVYAPVWTEMVFP